MFKDLFSNQPFWQQLIIAIIAGGLIALIGFFIRFVWRKFRRHSQSTDAAATEIDSPTQVAIGRGITQKIAMDKSRGKIVVAPVESKASLKADTFEKSVFIEAESGSTININIYNYQDGVANSEKPDVREYFAEGLKYYRNGQFKEAIEEFKRCVSIETYHKRLVAINIQIGNCYYSLQKYSKAAEYYGDGLREARKAKDREGEAAALGSLASSYLMRAALTEQARVDNARDAVRYYNEALEILKKDKHPVDYAMTQNYLGTAYTRLPAATPEEQAENIRKAMKCYREALEIRKRDKYPVEYATTQSDLGVAYTYLSAATPEERAENIRKAMKCYREALEILKKDRHPVDYARTQNNLGNAYSELPAATPEEQAENIRKAMKCYREALEIRRKNKYPIDYAMTQNGLGVAYMHLWAVASEEQAENIRKAIQCFEEALEIHRKDEYPQSYCFVAANIGVALILVTGMEIESCRWLKEAYALKQYLPSQGKGLEEIMRAVCRE